MKTNEHRISQRRMTATVGYLLGVKKEYMENYYPEEAKFYAELENNENATAIRHLNNIRSGLMLNYLTVEREMTYELGNLDRMSLFKDDVKKLAGIGIHIVRANYKVNRYLADINKLIADKIELVGDLFPEWVRRDYIKALFIMPHGLSEDSIKHESQKFSQNRTYYPYQKYMYWNPSDNGNILISDSKFLKVVYAQHNDVFVDKQKVFDADDTVKSNIYDFINDSNRTAIVVDCENSDVYKLASVLRQLNNDELEKISKIMLYDDIHTTRAWEFLDRFAHIPVEHIMVERIKDDKSLVDIKMSVGISKEYYTNATDSFIILSSDSDFWGVISSLPDAHFLVMVENSKCGPDIKKALTENDTYFCSIDDFCSGNIKDFKNAVLLSELHNKLDGLINIDSKDLLYSIYHDLRMEASETEKMNFYNKYIRKLSLTIDSNGIMSIKIPE